ncbi:MAG: hypothetical protein WCV50_01775 [Patescibacteria group bacterium]
MPVVGMMPWEICLACGAHCQPDCWRSCCGTCDVMVAKTSADRQDEIYKLLTVIGN